MQQPKLNEMFPMMRDEEHRRVLEQLAEMSRTIETIHMMSVSVEDPDVHYVPTFSST